MNLSSITKVFLGLFIILMFAGPDVSGASTEGKIDRSVIKLGDAKVHPELVFARLREPKRKNINNLLERAGFSVVKKYNLVDGLLLVNVNGKGMAVAKAQKPRYLQRRIAELEGS
ncbi:uncharacterized protein METZ01_LOCUS278727, partial [marine metagenome]